MGSLRNSQEYEDIRAFSIKFGLDPLPEPGFLSQSFTSYRVNFLYEEIMEFQIACADGDLEKAFDGLLDLVYVSMGTAYLMGLPFPEGWRRVHNANMQKERADGPSDPRSKRNSTFDVVKPVDWKPPYLKDLLE